jgi:Pectate lyase superfamily protein
MPNKSIPAIGDSNWGVTLNSHINQLTDPTYGGINRFDVFSARPTNLTADDAGKTYLYTQTGNLHQWIGTSWKVLNESVINVKDYGAIGDGVVDDTVAINAILSKPQSNNPTPINGNGNTIYFPEGTYAFNIQTEINTCKIKGSGNLSTFFKSFTPNGYAIAIDYNDAWNKIIIEDIAFIGDSGLTRGGIRFGVYDTTVLTPEGLPQIFIGGLVLKNCTFRDLNIGIYKPWGNIGNHFYDCSFYKCNYHILAKGYLQAGSPYTHHAGADTMNDCHFQAAQISSVYFDGGGANSTGNYVFSGCVFESNPGITFFVTNFASNGSFAAGLLFENVWFEEVVKDSTPRIINGVSYAPTVLIAIDSNVNFNSTNTVSCNLVRSNLFYNNCSDGVTVGADIVKDSKSSVIVSNLRLANGDVYDQTTGKKFNNFFTRDIIYEQNPIAGNYTITTQTKPRSIISYNNPNLLASESFADTSYFNINNINNNFINNIAVKDGIIFDKCIEINNFTGVQCYFDNYISIVIPANKYILWTVDAKIMNDGGQLIFNISNINGNLQSNNVFVESKQWSSYMGMGLSTTAKTTGLSFTSTKDTIARISAFQCLAFDTLQDMMNYVESGIYTTKQNVRNSGSEILPAAGTWTKGDLIYNTNPTPGGYVGWICTVSGTPGTWKEFGLIAA